jgi:hypothetical protein
MSKDNTEGGKLIDQVKPKKQQTQREINEELDNLEEVRPVTVDDNPPAKTLPKIKLKKKTVAEVPAEIPE